MAKSTISSLTPSVSVDGINTVTVHIDRDSTDYTHRVAFYIGNYAYPEYLEEYTGILTSKSFAIPTTWLNSIPNSVSGPCRCRVETFNGSISLGVVTADFVITVPESVIPVLNSVTHSKQVSESDPFAAGTYVRGISYVAISAVDVTNQYSATTANTLVVGTQAWRGTLPYTYWLTLPGSNYINVSVMDSRGRESTPNPFTVYVYDYHKPLVGVSGERCNSDGTLNSAGEYIAARMTVNVATVHDENTHTYTLEYKKVTDTDWIALDVSSFTDYSGAVTVITAASASYSWELRATIQDKLNTAQKTATVSTGTTGFDLLAGGTGAAFGKVAEYEGLETAWKVFGHGLDLTDIQSSYSTDALATAQDKGTFTGNVLLGQIVDISFTAGNTQYSTHMTIGAVTYSLVDLPAVAKINATQTYRFKKTAETTLTFISAPDYICEEGVDSNGWSYAKYAGGKSECSIYSVNLTMSASSAFGALYRYISNGTGGVGANLPAIFNALPDVFATLQSSSTTKAAPHGFSTGTGPYAAHLQYLGTASNASVSSQDISFKAIGKWK